jgi:hypothetical protein
MRCVARFGAAWTALTSPDPALVEQFSESHPNANEWLTTNPIDDWAAGVKLSSADGVLWFNEGGRLMPEARR